MLMIVIFDFLVGGGRNSEADFTLQGSCCGFAVLVSYQEEMIHTHCVRPPPPRSHSLSFSLSLSPLPFCDTKC